MHVAFLRRLLHVHLLAARGLGFQAQVLHHMRRRLRHHPAALVKALAAGPTGDLLELAHAEKAVLLSVELAQLGEQHRADGDVDPDAQGVGAADHLEQAALAQPLDQAAVARQQAGVVQADAVAEKAQQLLAIGAVQALVAQGGLDGLFLLLAAHVHAHQVLHFLGGCALGEVHQIDGRAIELDEVGNGFVQLGVPVLEVERHRTDRAAHARHLAAGEGRHLAFDGRGVAQGG